MVVMSSSQKQNRRFIGAMLGTNIETTPSLQATTSHNSQPQQSNSQGPSYHVSHSESSSDTDSHSSHASESLEDSSSEHADVNANADEISTDDEDESGRGPSRINKEWGTGTIMVLELNEHGQVVGPNAVEFSTQLGTVAKDGNKLPLTYTDWRAVPMADKNKVWEDVKANTNLDEIYKRTCLMRIGKLWRDWKSRVKSKYYHPYRHDKRYLLSHCPPRVEEDQWPILVQYWSSTDAKKLSKENRKHRKKQKMPHRMGRKDFANLREELRRNTGKVPSKLEVFIHSREARSGKPLDEITSNSIASMNEKKEKLPDALQDDNAAQDEILHDVIGHEKPGRLLTYGLGPTSSRISGTSNIMSAAQTKAFNDAVNEKVEVLYAELQSKIQAEMDEKLSRMKEECVEQLTIKWMPVMEERIRAEIEERIRAEFMCLDYSRKHVPESSGSHLDPITQNLASSDGGGNGHHYDHQVHNSIEVENRMNSMSQENATDPSHSLSLQEHSKRGRTKKRKINN